VLTRFRFDREPESGRITVLKGANLTGAHLYPGFDGSRHEGDLSEADLSGAILEHASLGDDTPSVSGGANLTPPQRLARAVLPERRSRRLRHREAEAQERRPLSPGPRLRAETAQV
jgi:hypothetical protein